MIQCLRVSRCDLSTAHSQVGTEFSSSPQSSFVSLPEEEAIPTVCLVGCSKAKLRHPAPAQDLYCSPLFQLCRRWAEQHADAWAILSAHHGLVLPDQVIQPYDTTIAQRRPFGQQPLSPREFGGWLYGQVQAWRARYATPSQGPVLIILAGKEYWRWLVEYRLEFSRAARRPEHRQAHPVAPAAHRRWP